MKFSIIIPTLNESATLESTLNALVNTVTEPDSCEIIISDGGSSDHSLQLANRFPVEVIHSEAGRARQMNAGALQARGDWLVFLHADTYLPSGWMSLIQCCDSDWGRFDVRLSGARWPFRVIERAMNLRSRITSVCTGDQVMFFRRTFFNKLDGFTEIPLMEDIATSKRARSEQKPACIQEFVVTSSRRWETKGIVRTVGLMWLLRLGYWLGIQPLVLHRLYYRDSKL